MVQPLKLLARVCFRDKLCKELIRKTGIPIQTVTGLAQVRVSVTPLIPEQSSVSPPAQPQSISSVRDEHTEIGIALDPRISQITFAIASWTTPAISPTIRKRTG